MAKKFCLVTRWNGTKFGWDWKVEFKESFELDRQILLKVVTKVGINFVRFEWMKANEMKPRVNIILTKVFFPADNPNLVNIQLNFAESQVELVYIV